MRLAGLPSITLPLLAPDPDYLSLPSLPPLPPRKEGCRCVIPAPEPTADSPRFHEHHARLDAQPASPAYREELTNHVHSGAAIILGLSALAWLILTSGVPYIAITATLIGLALDRRNFVFWLEAGLLYNLYASLILILSYR